MYLPGNEYDIGTATKIYARQCSSTVRTLLEAADGDVTEIIKTAENAKLNKKQREALDKWNKQKSEEEKASENSAAILEAIGQKPKLSRLARDCMMLVERDERKAKLKEEYMQHWGMTGPDFDDYWNEKNMENKDLPF